MDGALGHYQLQKQRVGKGERDELGDEGVGVGRAVTHAVSSAVEIEAEEVWGIFVMMRKQRQWFSQTELQVLQRVCLIGAGVERNVVEICDGADSASDDAVGWNDDGWWW